MAKMHYIVTSKKKAFINEEQGRKCVVINDAVKVIENQSMLFDYENLINDTQSQKTKLTCNDWFTLIAYTIAVLIILVLLVLLAIGRDFGIFTNNNIDNVIGIAALLFGIISIPKVKMFLGKRFKERRIIIKLWYCIIVLFLPFLIIWLMQIAGLPIGISNICGIIGLFISIYNL